LPRAGRPILVLLGLLLLGAFLAGQAGTAAAAPSQTSQLERVREKIREAEATRQSALAAIEAFDRKIDDLEKGLSGLSRDRDRVAARLQQTRGRLDALASELERKAAVLSKAEQDLDHQQQVLNARVVNIYKSGRLGYVEVLFNTTRLNDLVNRFDLLERIGAQDSEMLGEIQTLRTEVTAEKKSLERDQAAVEVVEREQQEQAGRLETLVAERQSTIDRLDGARDDKHALAQRAAGDKATYEAQEDALLAQSDRLAAQLRGVTGAAAAPGARGSGGVISVGQGYLRPVPGSVSSGFGYRIHPIFGSRRMHTGWDMSAGFGVPIRAARGGTVVSAGWMGGYGKAVVVSHGGGMSTLYAHQSSIAVGVGQRVSQGQVLGYVGSTGYSTGPHLHFEVRTNGAPVNPGNYL